MVGGEFTKDQNRTPRKATDCMCLQYLDRDVPHSARYRRNQQRVPGRFARLHAEETSQIREGHITPPLGIEG